MVAASVSCERGGGCQTAQVHVTFVAGVLDKSYFGTVQELPTQIFTKVGEHSFNSIGLKGYTAEGVPVYKIFRSARIAIDEKAINK